ncbi:MAG: hypothetical protein H6617_09380 [Bdellovibrionaceae bacterium]|nr:hypothetical protein [Bdellovibrionales bacterium]MCB9254880.1 hypothetical protein [Pseudobdellovibrionaceae bacterium]
MKFVLCTLSLVLSLTSVALSPEDSAIFSRLEKQLKGQHDVIRRTVTRKGDKTIELEGFISTELNLELAKPLLTNFARYQSWALRDINKKPDGGEYMLKLLSVLPLPSDDNVLQLRYLLDVPLFSSIGVQPFRMSSAQKDGYLELKAEAVTSKKSLIDWAVGTAKIFPAPGERHRVWVYTLGRMRLHPWLMYEALPDRLLNRLVANRIKTFLDNLLEEQDKRAQPGPIPRHLSADK